MFRSIRGRVTLTFILLAVIPLLIAGFVLTQQSFSAQQQEAIYAAQQVVQRVASDIENFISLREKELRLAADSYSLYSAQSDEYGAGVFNLLLSQNIYDQIIVTDATGQEQIHISRFTLGNTLQLENISDEAVFQVPFENMQSYYGPVQFDDASGEPTMTISIPLQDLQTGTVVAVVIAEFRFRAVWNLIADTNVNSDTFIYVTNRENAVIAHQNPSVVLQNTIFDVPETDGVHAGLHGEDSVLVSQNIVFGNQSFTVVSELPVRVAFALAFNTVTTTVIVLFVSVLIAGSLGVLVARTLAQPIEELAQTALSIAEGDLEKRARTESSDEIGILAKAFNKMTEQLSQLIGNLEQRVEERTRDLNIAAAVSQQVTRVLDMDELLPYLANLTRDGFGLAHVSVFVYEKATNTLQLKAGSGDVGKQMLKEGKQFHLQDKGLVPLAGRSLAAQVINDVTDSKDYFTNPLLAETRSELAIPMRVGTELIGVLDMQSNTINHFTTEQSNVLTSLADQIAVAVRNADLFQDAELSRAEAEKANVVKSQFLAAMSHELRTPLNAVLNFTQFVSSGMLGDVNSEQVEMLDKVVQSGKHLLSLINDVLDISKIEAGALKLYVEENIVVASEAETAIATAKSLLSEKPVNLQVEIQENLPPVVGDRRRLRQVMLNLLSNACKFTEEGEIHVSLKEQDDKILFVVRDTGPGIAMEDHSLIFETFRQSSTGLRQGEGTGLGLPISRRLAEAHGGQLWLESTIGVGTSFYFSIPVNNPTLISLAKRKEASNNVA